MKFSSSNLIALLKKASKKIQTTLLSVFIIVLIGAATVIGIDYWVSWQAKGRIITQIEDVPQREVAVVLGTSKYLGRTLNEYYKHRIDAAIDSD